VEQLVIGGTKVPIFHGRKEVFFTCFPNMKRTERASSFGNSFKLDSTYSRKQGSFGQTAQHPLL
jgi:hypothetical protein